VKWYEAVDVTCVKAYEIIVFTTDREDAGTQHSAWLILEGDERTSSEFLMENSHRNRILRRYTSSSTKHSFLQILFNSSTPTVAIWVHPLPADRVKPPSFVIFDFRALWRSGLRAERQSARMSKVQMTA